MADLAPYSPRLLLEWEHASPDLRHRAIEGTLVFADVSGFTRLSERLAAVAGKAGAEELADIIGALFGDLLTVAGRRGGEMLKYGGDAVLVFFRGDGHVERAAAGSIEMQERLREIGRVDAGGKPIRLRMSVGMNSGAFDLFKVGTRHQELVIAGPATTETVRMEATADAGEVLVSAATAARLPATALGGPKDDGRLLRRAPAAFTSPIAAVSAGTSVAHRLVAPDLVDHLSGDPDHRLATVSFLHITGVDDVLRRKGAEVAAAWLDETVGSIQAALAAYGVTFLATDLAADGTKVMAAAGAPVATEDAERRMLLALRQVLDRGTPLPVKAGVNRGHVFAAAVGPSFRRTYTTLGDVVNTAARLCARAAPGEILVLDPVLEPTRGTFEVTALPAFVAKGKALPLEPKRVDGERGSLGTDGEATVTPTVRFAGRSREVATLRHAAERAADGVGSLVEIVGEMGVGKTRLLTEALGGCDLAAHVVHCEPYETVTAFHPFKRLLRRALFGDHEPDDVGPALRTAVAQLAPGLLPWLPLVADVLDATIPPTPETEALDTRFRLQRTAAVTTDLLLAALPQPTVIVFEDTHWIDDASATVLRRIESTVTSAPWLVCTTRRPERSAFTATAATSTTLDLAPLTDGEAMCLVAEVGGDVAIPPHTREAILRRAEGNPLFLTELLAGVARGGDVPERLEAVMAAQIDRLAPDDRRVLRHAAVLGSRFTLDVLAAVTGDRSLATSSARAVSARLQLLVVPEGRGQLRFRHQLVRDVAYESLPFRVRRDLHRRAGEVLEELPRAGAELAEVLSLHFSSARDHARAWRYARAAADRARERFANAEAAVLLDRALTASRELDSIAMAEVAETWGYLGECRMYLGDGAGARTAFRRARALHRDAPMRVAKLCHVEARLAQREGRQDAATRWVRRGLDALRGDDGPDACGLRAELLVLQAWMKNAAGRPRDAIRWANRSLAEAELAGNQRVVAYANMVLDGADVTLGRRGDPARAQRALQIYEDLGLLEDLAVVLNNLGNHSYYQGRWSEALRMFDRATSALTRVGDLMLAGLGEVNVAEILIDQGRCDEALERLDAAESTLRSLGEEVGLAFVWSHRGRVAVHRGETDAAETLFREARTHFERYGYGTYVLEVDARLADCALRAGDIPRARAAVDAALEADRAAGGSRLTPMLLRILGYCCAAAGETSDAWAAMDESLHLAREAGGAYDVALALEGFDVLVEAGATDTGAAAERAAERRALLDELDVVSTPKPALALAG
jgi:class 3 adenylate cyclase/tetratricopeptide (TPR) repeat protein